MRAWVPATFREKRGWLPGKDEKKERAAGGSGQAFRGDRQVASFRDPYLEHFYRVQLVFRHQRVWDAAAQEVRMLCRPEGPLADDDSCDTDYVGPPLPPAAGRLVSCGALDPRTLLPSALFVEER